MASGTINRTPPLQTGSNASRVLAANDGNGMPVIRVYNGDDYGQFFAGIVGTGKSIRTRSFANGSVGDEIICPDYRSLLRSGTVAAALESNKVSTTHVTFPTAFNSAPAVMVMPNQFFSDSAQAFLANLSVLVNNVTATGFDLLVGYNGTTSITSISVGYLAVGY